MYILGLSLSRGEDIGISLTVLTRHIFVPVLSKNLDFQRHMLRYFFVFRVCVFVVLISVEILTITVLTFCS